MAVELKLYGVDFKISFWAVNEIKIIYLNLNATATDVTDLVEVLGNM